MEEAMNTANDRTQVDVGLTASKAETVAEALNTYLANLQVLYTKLHNYHWNIEGDSFFTLHAQLEQMYNVVNAEIDEVAERILKIGFRPMARGVDYVKHSDIQEVPSKAYHGKDIAETLAGDYRTLCVKLRHLISAAEKAGDDGTADDATAYLKDKEQMVWMLTAYKS
ncbi:MAG: DNA starvation/stationary phase protection protein [Spirochaetaceae bacterium]|nr:MAG: DNA starvation/stationary phase protection protein [Spirochaetaceae bacterium]